MVTKRSSNTSIKVICAHWLTTSYSVPPRRGTGPRPSLWARCHPETAKKARKACSLKTPRNKESNSLLNPSPAFHLPSPRAHRLWHIPKTAKSRHKLQLRAAGGRLGFTKILATPTDPPPLRPRPVRKLHGDGGISFHPSRHGPYSVLA